jgi:hypothetical protein
MLCNVCFKLLIDTRRGERAVTGLSSVRLKAFQNLDLLVSFDPNHATRTWKISQLRLKVLKS